LKNSRRVKAQIASLDIIISVIAIMILIGVIAIIISITIKPEAKAIYGGEVFRNIENIDGPNNFLDGYRINQTALTHFVTVGTYDSKKSLVLEPSTQFSSTRNNFTMFFLGKNGVVDITPGMSSYGHSAGSYSNPCNGHKQSFVYIRPVLKGQETRKGEILNMYVVVCE